MKIRTYVSVKYSIDPTTLPEDGCCITWIDQDNQSWTGRYEASTQCFIHDILTGGQHITGALYVVSWLPC